MTLDELIIKIEKIRKNSKIVETGTKILKIYSSINEELKKELQEWLSESYSGIFYGNLENQEVDVSEAYKKLDLSSMHQFDRYIIAHECALKLEAKELIDLNGVVYFYKS